MLFGGFSVRKELKTKPKQDGFTSVAPIPTYTGRDFNMSVEK